MDVKYRYLQRPMLVLVHYDFPNQRLREDYYNLAGGRTERIFTSIKLYNDVRRELLARAGDARRPSS